MSLRRSLIERRKAKPPPSAIFGTCPDLLTLYPSYDLLRFHVSHHASTIASRWSSKKTSQRAKLLSRAFSATFPPDSPVHFTPALPSTQPQLSQRLFAEEGWWDENKDMPTGSIYEFLFGFINVEQLSPSPAALLHLIHSRALREPYELARDDYINILSILKLFKRDGTRALAGRAVSLVDMRTVTLSPATGRGGYGTFERVPPSEMTPDALLGMEAEILFRFQKGAVEFCLNCVVDILGKEVENVSGSGELEEGFADALLVPDDQQLPWAYYTRITGISFSPTIDKALLYAISALRRAEDNLNHLKSSQSYFLHDISTRLDHSHTHTSLLDGSPEVENNSELVDEALKQVVFFAHARRVLWNNIAYHTQRLIGLLEFAQFDGVDNTDEIRGEAGEVYGLFKLLLRNLEHDAAINGYSSPQLREYFRRTKKEEGGKFTILRWEGVTEADIYNSNPVYGVLLDLTPRETAKRRLGVEIVGLEAEYLLSSKGKDVHPWYATILSDFAVTTEIMHVLYSHLFDLSPSSLPHPEADTVGAHFNTLYDVFRSGLLLPSVKSYEMLLSVLKRGNGLKEIWQEVDGTLKGWDYCCLEEWTGRYLLPITGQRGTWEWKNLEEVMEVEEVEYGRVYAKWNDALLWILPPDGPTTVTVTVSKRVFAGITSLASGTALAYKDLHRHLSLIQKKG